MIVKEELREKYQKGGKKKYLATNNTTKNIQDTGLFKLEFEVERMLDQASATKRIKKMAKFPIDLEE